MGFKQFHFVLVHGAGQGAWCWVKITAALEKGGHRVTAVDLASTGENPEIADEVSSLEQYTQPLEDLFASFSDDEKVILVGHSLGGMSITRISELFPKRILVAVYLAAFMPANGVDLNVFRVTNPDFLPDGDDPQLVFVYSKVEGGPITSMDIPLETLRKAFYNKCSDEDFDFAVPRRKKFPSLIPLFSVIPLTEENYGSVPRIQVLGLHDKAISVESARILAALNPPKEVHEIDGDHNLVFSAVEDVTNTLVDAAAKYDT